MGTDSKIEWTRHTHNPWIGCTAVSPACDHCYAERLGQRFGVKWGASEERRRTSEAYRRQPFTWDRAAAKAGRVDNVFSASLADIWDNAVPIEWLVEELDTIRLTLHLRWLLLTKRPQLIRRRLEAALKHLSEGTDRDDLIGWLAMWLSGSPPPNVWLGTTVENQAEADRRIPHLLAIPAARRFLSCEPLLEAVDLRAWWRNDVPSGSYMHGNGLHWIIAGGESGPTARPSHPNWFRSLRDQCQAAGVPFFFKQWGEFEPAVQSADKLSLVTASGLEWYGDDGADILLSAAMDHQGAPQHLDGRFWASGNGLLLHRTGKKATGATLDGRQWREVPA